MWGFILVYLSAFVTAFSAFPKEDRFLSQYTVGTLFSFRQGQDWHAMRQCEYVRHDCKAASELPPEGGHNGLNFGVTTNCTVMASV